MYSSSENPHLNSNSTKFRFCTWNVGTMKGRSAEIIEMNKDVIRSGDYAKVRMRFNLPVFVLKGDHFVFRESKSKGVGKIVSIH